MTPTPPQKASRKRDIEFVKRLDELIADLLCDPHLSSAKLAGHFCVCQRQFARQVKRLLGMNTTQYIQHKRVERASRLLCNTELTITDIYVKCGFDSANYFTRVFHNITGVTPSAFRRTARSAAGQSKDTPCKKTK